MNQDHANAYFGELYVTTTFTVDSPKYVGRRIRNYKIGNAVLFIIGVVVIIGVFYFQWQKIVSLLAIVGVSIWVYFNSRKIQDFNKDLDNEPLEIIGVVKKRKKILYPACEIELEGIKERFKTDAGFIRRTKIGDKVCFIYTPKLKLVKAWQSFEGHVPENKTKL